MKRHRRYREKNFAPTVASVRGDTVHDFLKGWGIINKDGSVLWESWRPPTKRHLAKMERLWKKRPPFSSFKMPVINTIFPTLLIRDLVSVQPMS